MPTDFAMRPEPGQPTVRPYLPRAWLDQVARHLDHEAGLALNRGERLFAERASHRAAELREMAGAVR